MKFIKKYKYYFLSFIVPLCIYLVLYHFIGFYFEKRYLSSDAYAQYVPTFKYFYNVLHGNATFPYTLTKGMGGTMYGAFFYGLSSPLNLLVYFFEDAYLFVFLLSVFKLSLCGLTAFIYLRKVSNQNNIVIFIFSLLYSFMGYNVVYGFNVMWLDSVFLAPLLLLVIDNYIIKDKHLGYIFILLYTIISNYYTGYIMVIFSIIYFIYKLYLDYNASHFIKDNYKKIIKFLLITFLIGCMTMFILIPTAIESMSFIRIDENFKLINFNFFDLFAGGFIGMGNMVNTLNDRAILIYFSLVSVPLIINYFYSNEISKKEKKANILVLLSFFIPVIVPFFNRLWHMFTMPQLFNYRYSYLIVLFLLPICLKSLEKIKCTKKAYGIFICGYLILVVSLIYNVKTVPDYYMYLSPAKIIISSLLLIIYVILLLNNKRKTVYFLIIIELVINLTWIGIDSRNLSKNVLKTYTTTDNTVLKSKCESNYRCEELKNLEDSNLYNNYNGVSIFLSSTNRKTLDFLWSSTGLNSLEGNLYSYNYDDILLDIFLGVKYISTKDKLNYYNLVDYDSDTEKYLYENHNNFSLGFLVNPNIKDFKSENNGLVFFRELFNTMFDRNESYIKEVNYTKINDNKYIAHIEEDVPYLFLETDKPVTNIQVDLASKDDYGILYNVEKGDIELEFEDGLSKIKLYYLNTKVLEKLKDNLISLNITENNGNYIKGDIDVDKDCALFTTIPYELGWKVYVDGKLVKHYETINTFMALDLKKGNHIVEFKYNVPYLELGIIISLLSATTLVVYELKRRK